MEKSYFDFGLYIRASASFEEIQIRFSVKVPGANVVEINLPLCREELILCYQCIYDHESLVASNTSSIIWFPNSIILLFSVTNFLFS